MSIRVYSRTKKGEEEIQRRSHGLDLNRRRTLILINGNATVDHIRRNAAGIEDVDACLDSLLAEGFIEARLTLKARLIEIAREILGEDAEKIVRKIEEAPDTPEGLKAAAEGCKKLVKLTISEKKAEEMIRRCREVFEET